MQYLHYQHYPYITNITIQYLHYQHYPTIPTLPKLPYITLHYPTLPILLLIIISGINQYQWYQ